MDHWGDPWADDAYASNTKSSPREELTPPPPRLSTAPVLLDAFLDDAQWGSAGDEEERGIWATSPQTSGTARGTETETRVTDAGPISTNRLDSATEKGGFELNNEGWGREADIEVSETSDSATTTRPDDTPKRIPPDSSDSPQPDDDHSTRPPTSPSDVSLTEAPTESPRTSFEEERIAGEAAVADKTPISGKHTRESVTESEAVENESLESDDFGDFEEHVEEAASALEIADDQPEPGRSEETRDVVIAGLGPDLSLLKQLFPSPTTSSEPLATPEDLIYSTSTRKAWYRLTRKQTMREFNSGGDENNYVRVTWANSRIKSDVTKIVSRWATEDRMSGRGAAGRASFYRDQPTKTETKTRNHHSRTESSISVSNPIQPTKASVQPLSTNVPAAFNWSSTPSAAHDPWKQDSPGIQAVSFPMDIKPETTSVQENRSVSIDFTTGDPPQASHKKTTSLISPLLPNEKSPTYPTTVSHVPVSSMDADPWADVSTVDSTSPFKRENSAVEENDDWGDMVESPAVSTPAPVEEVSQNSSQIQTLSTPATTPKSVRSSPFQPAPSKHASPIVRLKGVVSPTSALFKYNSFVPDTVEEKPIGPGLLKPMAKPPQTTPEKPGTDPRLPSNIDEVLGQKAEEPEIQANSRDEFPTLASSTPQTTANEPDDVPYFEPSTSQPRLVQSVPSSPPPAQPATDAWSDADFSFFEAAAPAPALPQPHPDPSDPFSVFETPAPPSARAPPQAPSPPPKQPLTAASNSAQRRKAEENEIIRDIVEGLPDLRYMLRR